MDNKNNKILNIFAGKGFFLDKELLGFLSGLENSVVCEIADILVSIGIKEKVITKGVFNKYSDKFDVVFNTKGGDITKGRVNLLSDLNFFLKKIKVEDFVNYFRDRYEKMRGILEIRNFVNLSSIRRIGEKNGVYIIVAMVSGKRVTKNKNLLLEVEDLTGKVSVLISYENTDLFKFAKDLLLDDVVVFGVSGSRNMLFVNNIIYPEVALREEKFGDIDEYIAFSGDCHIGSDKFLEKKFLKFIEWLNGNVGDDKQKIVARKVKYLFLAGDCVEGIGVYSGQEKSLNIKDYLGQYKRVEDFLRRIRQDVKIIMCPGQHDAVWVGEPQFPISKKFAPGLHDMNNLYMVSNPSLVEVDGGFRILVYHGASINRFINEMPKLRRPESGSQWPAVGGRNSGDGHMCPTRVMKEFLKHGHLAPVYGVMDYFLCGGRDSLVIDVVPDIVMTGDQHRAEVGVYNNVLLVSGSCWQSITSFEKKTGNVPDPCKVPLFNLKTREVKILDFGDDDVKLEEIENV